MTFHVHVFATRFQNLAVVPRGATWVLLSHVFGAPPWTRGAEGGTCTAVLWAAALRLVRGWCLPRGSCCECGGEGHTTTSPEWDEARQVFSFEFLCLSCGIKHVYFKLLPVRQHLSRLPTIDPNTRTLLLCGYPNVGKSSFINKVSLSLMVTQVTEDLRPKRCVPAVWDGGRGPLVSSW